MAAAQKDYKFEGWGAFDKDAVKGNFKWFEYEPKKFANDDVDIEIMYCGVCGTDAHVASSGWGDMGTFYKDGLVVGHEIVGKVVRVGPDVKHLKVGDIAGVGAQCDSCGKCHNCDHEAENYCQTGLTQTYGDVFKRTDGSATRGGYANYWRGPSHFIVPIPAGLDPAEAAPMLCGGVTVYSPLVKYGAGKTAKDVGVIGIGGLGHFALLFAEAMGANVTAITSSDKKVEDAKKLGASKVIVTGDDAGAAVKDHTGSLDLIICTSNDPNMPLAEYLSLLKTGGHFIVLGIAETESLPKIHPFQLVLNNIHIAGSLIGSPKEISDMLAFVAEKQIHPVIQKYKMDDVNTAIPDFVAGKAKYRYVLVNEKNGGKM